MPKIATRRTRVSDVVKSEFGLDRNYGREVRSLTLDGTEDIGAVFKSGGAIVSSADSLYAITPAVANSAVYELSVSVDGTTKAYSYTSDASATASEIAAGLAALINADADVNGSVTAADNAGVLEIDLDKVADVSVTVLTTNLAVEKPLDDLAILVDDTIYTDFTTAGAYNCAVLVGGPGASSPNEVRRGGLKFGDSLTAAQKDTVASVLRAQGIKIVA